MKRKHALAVSGIALGLTGLAAGCTPPASTATTAYRGDASQVTCLQPGSTACLAVAVEGRVGTAFAPNDSAAAGAYVSIEPSDRLIARVQIDKVVLSTQAGAVVTSGSANSGTARSAQARTSPVLWSKDCATNYQVSVQWSARLNDGQLKSGKLAGPWFKSPACS